MNDDTTSPFIEELDPGIHVAAEGSKLSEQMRIVSTDDALVALERLSLDDKLLLLRALISKE